MKEGIKLIALVKAKPGMSRSEFEQRWIKTHAPLSLKMQRLKGYRINLPSEQHQEIEGELPFDGTAELWWDSLEDMMADFNSEEGKAAGADGASFLMPVHIYTREYVLK